MPEEKKKKKEKKELGKHEVLSHAHLTFQICGTAFRG